jgi:hypothetical protein
MTTWNHALYYFWIKIDQKHYKRLFLWSGVAVHRAHYKQYHVRSSDLMHAGPGQLHHQHLDVAGQPYVFSRCC